MTLFLAFVAFEFWTSNFRTVGDSVALFFATLADDEGVRFFIVLGTLISAPGHWPPVPCPLVSLLSVLRCHCSH